ncbi:asparagine synthase (glutamine-hydrolyzing) [Arthrobacter sp. H14]|uniref:asparagine synthase (glutamine-hydrolyzing) n=1 Tax=Arthrobacter sp. H14 TaxID=1312959 RepID=UPI0009DF54EB|nr:asparagine synthase (glutamine-hydrolyzing) [Arthrobacter sp. H14]
MCGIVAVHRTDSPAVSAADISAGERMLDRIIHRGPDGRASRQVGQTFLGHNRLSIVDLPGGNQPIGSDHGHWLVANGEIYNHAELRADSTYRFRTDSDNEAVLAVALQQGIDAIGDLRGMYAFVIAREDGTFIAARDELGVKPLYWADVDGAVYFASELRAFDEKIRPEVREFPPGHAWSSSEGLIRTKRYVPPVPAPADRAEAVRRIRETVITAVRRRMMADIPVGVFLSGGLDSSIVAAVMARYADNKWGPVRSFAAGTEGSSDLIAARRIAEHLGLDHTERVYSSDEAVNALPSVVASIESFEPSLVRSAVPNYLLAETAAQSVKVVLTGEGADELFAGYDHLREIEESQLQEELERSVRGLHNLNLQRCDRVTMAHGLEARVPFLDRDVVNLAEQIPIAWRLPGLYGQEKALLREAFEGWLPDDLLWRPKEQFGDGSGTADVMRERATDFESSANWHEERVAGLDAPRSREELAYQRLFAAELAGIDAAVLGRFATA